MILLIDNYDSFTYNLFHFLGDLGAEVEVRRNDALSADEALAMNPDAIVISPGPCDPPQAGICLELIEKAAASRTPLLGVCLGHQSIGEALGAKVVRAPAPMHGKTDAINRKPGAALFEGMPESFTATRYHSLMVDREGLPDELEIVAESADGVIQAVSHKTLPMHGVQFHPESIASEGGHDLLRNFLELAKKERGRNVMSEPLNDMKAVIAKVATGASLSEDEAAKAFDIIMSGDATQAQIGAFLMGLRVRGETVEEISGAVRVMRDKALKVSAPPDAIDVVGTGGDASGTYNISTGAAIVVAGCGVPVAKHGNRALSSKSGAADVLTSLGVNLDADMPLVEKSISEAKIGFLMAPRHHSAMKHVAAPRMEMGTRTVFNLLGPLSNPAGVKRQFTGAFSRDWITPMAEVLGRLGCERAWVVHGSDGLDELTTTGPSFVAEIRDGQVSAFEVAPEDAGLPLASPEDLKGGDPETNAQAILDMLDGKPGPYRDVVCYNAAAALIVAGKCDSLKEGADMAQAAIDDGRAKAALEHMVSITNS